MARVVFRLPSKKIQYGYAEIEFEADDLARVSDLGSKYAEFALAFQAAEIDAFEAAKTNAETGRRGFGAVVPPEYVRADPAEAKPPASPPVTEATADQLIKSELGGRVVSEGTAPWDEPAPPAAEPWKNQTQTVKTWEGPTPSFDFGN